MTSSLTARLRAVFVACLALVLLGTYYMDFGFFRGLVDMNGVGLALLYLSVFFTLTSAGEYDAFFVDAIEAKDKRLAERERPEGDAEE